MLFSGLGRFTCPGEGEFATYGGDTDPSIPNPESKTLAAVSKTIRPLSRGLIS